MGGGARVRRGDQEWEEVLVLGGVIKNVRRFSC